MATLTYTSREEIEVHKFSAVATIGIPLLAVFVQSYAPRTLSFVQIFDIPLIVTIFFAVARRNPIAGTVTGCVIGLVQDSLAGLPLGIFGIAKSLIGYMASSIGMKVDVDNPGSRFLITFGFSIVHNLIYFLVATYMVRIATEWHTVHELGRSVANAFLALVLFAIMDRAKKR